MTENSYHKTYSFPNGYCASVICNHSSYGGIDGLFEVAVMYNSEIVYDTPVTKDVVGYLDFVGVCGILKAIEELPERN